MLIAHYEHAVCFTYPKDQTNSQMFYSANITCEDVAERLRSTDTIKECAQKLRDECKQYQFELDETYKLAEDCDLSYDKYTTNRPASWVKFFSTLFPDHSKSASIQRKCYTFFSNMSLYVA